MKKDIHPAKRPVIFHDNSSGERFLIASTIETEKTAKWEDGTEYPLTEVEISSASHPFYTGKKTVVDTAGRVQKFEKRMDTASKKKEELKKIETNRAKLAKEKTLKEAKEKQTKKKSTKK